MGPWGPRLMPRNFPAVSRAHALALAPLPSPCAPPPPITWTRGPVKAVSHWPGQQGHAHHSSDMHEGAGCLLGQGGKKPSWTASSSSETLQEKTGGLLLQPCSQKARWWGCTKYSKDPNYLIPPPPTLLLHQALQRTTQSDLQPCLKYWLKSGEGRKNTPKSQ